MRWALRAPYISKLTWQPLASTRPGRFGCRAKRSRQKSRNGPHLLFRQVGARRRLEGRGQRPAACVRGGGGGGEGVGLGAGRGGGWGCGGGKPHHFGAVELFVQVGGL